MALDHSVYQNPDKMRILNASWQHLPHFAQGKFGVKEDDLGGVCSYYAMYGSDWHFPVNPGGHGQFTLNIVKINEEDVPAMKQTIA